VLLADYVVSFSLQINNRCLRHLAECDAHGGFTQAKEGAEGFVGEVQTVYTESLLARDSRRLVSLWALMKPAWKGSSPGLTEHVEALQVGAQALTGAASVRRLAMRLAALVSEDYEAEAILRVARKLPAELPLTWDALNELFTTDSHFWRASPGFDELPDADIAQRITRSYRKAYRYAGLMLNETTGSWLDSQGDNFDHWVGLTTHQLELLRDGLSDKGKAQLWYLGKLSDTLRTRSGLCELRSATREAKVKKATRKLVIRYIDQQIQKMDKRAAKLCEGCFCRKPKRLNILAHRAVAALALNDIAIMNYASGPIVRPTPTTGDNAYG